VLAITNALVSHCAAIKTPSVTSTPMLLARSRHASVGSLERYARPGVDAVARHVAERAPPPGGRAGRLQDQLLAACGPFDAYLGHKWATRLVRALMILNQHEIAC
jgi:hypothetical protein